MLTDAYLECANMYMEMEEYDKADDILEKGIMKLKKDKDGRELLEELLEEIQAKSRPEMRPENPSAWTQLNKVIIATNGYAEGR